MGFHSLKPSPSRKFIGPRLNGVKVRHHGLNFRKSWNFMKSRNRRISSRNHVSGLHFIEISVESLRCAQCFSYRFRWSTCILPRVREWCDHILWGRAVSCTFRGLKSSNLACRDGFPSRRLVSSNTALAHSALAHSANLGQACPVPICKIFAVIWSRFWF